MKKFLVVLMAVCVAALLFSCKFGQSGGETAAPAAGTAAATGTTPPAATTPAASSPVKVTLSWDKPIDMDLEIWNAAGTSMIHRAFAQPNLGWNGANCGTDVTDGTQGQEFFIFKNIGTEDFSNGQYVISVYFASMGQNSSISEAFATVTITKPDGTTQPFRRKIQYQPGQDQWHCCRIDATTGAVIEELDKFITVQQNQNQ
ncbi:MAG TPA: hypothetical protein PKM88_07120 [bacterium]|nr:hypothetical protein [bacterium]